jgi:hypothetical protein
VGGDHKFLSFRAWMNQMFQRARATHEGLNSLRALSGSCEVTGRAECSAEFRFGMSNAGDIA